MNFYLNLICFIIIIIILNKKNIRFRVDTILVKWLLVLAICCRVLKSPTMTRILLNIKLHFTSHIKILSPIALMIVLILQSVESFFGWSDESLNQIMRSDEIFISMTTLSNQVSKYKSELLFQKINKSINMNNSPSHIISNCSILNVFLYVCPNKATTRATIMKSHRSLVL